MGPLRLTVGVVGIFVISLLSMLPPVDDPRTSFDETDSPINIGAPVLMRIASFKPPMQARTVVGAFPTNPIPAIDQKGAQPVSRQSCAHLDLLQELLC